MFVPKTSWKVQFTIDAVLVAFLKDNSPSIYNRHKLLLIVQIMRDGQLVHILAFIDTEKLAISKVGHYYALS